MDSLSIPMNGAQLRIIEQNSCGEAIRCCNVGALVELARQVNVSCLVESLNMLSLEHDVFGLYFSSSLTGWEQLNAISHREIGISIYHDLELESVKKRVYDEFSLTNVDRIPLVRAGIFCDQDETTCKYLVIVANHLVMDIESINIFLKKLERQILLPNASKKLESNSSFSDYCLSIHNLCNSINTSLFDELGKINAAPLRIGPIAYSRLISFQKTSCIVSAENWQTLSKLFIRKYKTFIGQGLFGLLMYAFMKWIGEGILPVTIVGNGRFVSNADDYSFTLGCLAFPRNLAIELRADESIDQCLERMKSTYDVDPAKSHAIYRKYIMGNRKNELMEPEISINYLGPRAEIKDSLFAKKVEYQTKKSNTITTLKLLINIETTNDYAEFILRYDSKALSIGDIELLKKYITESVCEIVS